DLLLKTGFSLAETAMMGDDWIDLPILRQVGLAVTVPEASLLIKQHAHYVTTATGGHGAVREVCELILAAQNKLNLVLQRYLA
ncbi:MAG: HAD hydrolase family protein, partial [Neisseriaceae bacterium]|nr:HAD hydrolase family protein [Neisseriaceae bacterium]